MAWAAVNPPLYHKAATQLHHAMCSAQTQGTQHLLSPSGLDSPWQNSCHQEPMPQHFKFPFPQIPITIKLFVKAKAALHRIALLSPFLSLLYRLRSQGRMKFNLGASVSSFSFPGPGVLQSRHCVPCSETHLGRASLSTDFGGSQRPVLVG